MKLEFKNWLELTIDRIEAKDIVLDALGAKSSDAESVLASRIREQPELEQKLGNYAELRPYINDIIGFMRSNPDRNLIDLVNYIYKVDDERGSGQIGDL